MSVTESENHGERVPCGRCGDWAGIRRQRFGVSLCERCAERDPIPVFASSLNRSWKLLSLIGFQTLGNAMIATLAIAALFNNTLSLGSKALTGLIGVIAALVSIGTFTRRPWTRFGGAWSWLIYAGLVFAMLPEPRLPDGLYIFILPALLSLLTYGNAIGLEGQLYYGLPISDKALEVHWEARNGNFAGTVAGRCGPLGFVIPIFAAIAIITGLWGLWVADENAWPPRGKRKESIRGLIYGLLAALMWIAILHFGGSQ